MRKNVRLETITPQWLENSKMRVKESTYVKYVNLATNHILPQLGEVQVSCLTTEVIEQFVQYKLSRGKKNGKGGLSEKTVKDMLIVLKEICRYASLQAMEVPCHFDLIRVRSCDSEVNVLDRRHQVRLERFLMRDNSLKKTGILLSLCMGLRLGEICALRKENILYKEEILQVRTTMQRIQDYETDENDKTKKIRKTKIIITSPKSSCSVRDIPIPSFMLERLGRLKYRKDNVFVLTGLDNDFIEPRTLENIFKRYLTECNLDTTNFHTLRHTFATRCIEKGFDVKTLSEILGHANVNITLNRYVHSSMEQKRKWMNELTIGVLN